MVGVKDQTKKEWRRKIRRRRREAVSLSRQADQKVENLLIRRFDRLVSVRRFVLLWVALFILLIIGSVLQFRALSSHYQALKPVSGGIFNEGIIGSFTNANPLYASGAADTAVTRLVFSGLLKYDQTNNLAGDLAESWQINEARTRYTLKLKENIVWHDNKPFTADDVVFTYQTLQNIEAQSSLYSSWQGITVAKQDSHTVTFDLPNPLGSFLHSLTNGIVPKHILADSQPEHLRSDPFNTSPIGTGPFQWRSVEVSGLNSTDRQQRVTLGAFDKYWADRPKLDGFSIITFTDEQHLVEAFENKQLNGMSGLEALPESLKKDNHVQAYATALTASVMAFYNNSNPTLGNVGVRRALTHGVDRKQLPELFDYPTRFSDSPLLRGQLGYNRRITQLPYDQARANKLLDEAGWTRGKGGQRFQDNKPLTLNLSTQDTQNYSKVAKFLQEQWGKLGVKLDVKYYNGEDLQAFVIGSHDYDILLYGISIGVDPDIYAYWDSSQASLTSQGRLNLSEYKSTAADQAIQFARTRSDESIRAVKYRAFLTEWAKDAPALALYQPNFLYVSRG
ncbi:MAG: peptide ABC transporter substrate-binding protein, partial [Candidatus Saccharimonadales bacterium]